MFFLQGIDFETRGSTAISRRSDSRRRNRGFGRSQGLLSRSPVGHAHEENRRGRQQQKLRGQKIHSVSTFLVDSAYESTKS